MTGDELAAVVVALQTVRPCEFQTQPEMSVWKRSMLEPELDVDALRAAARRERHVW